MTVSDKVSSFDAIFTRGGETGELMRSQDWSGLAVGEPSTWAPELKSLVGLIIRAQIPMAIFWGKEAALFFNDTWRDLFCARAVTCGQPAYEAIPEIWGEIARAVADVGSSQDAGRVRDLSLRSDQDAFPPGRRFNLEFSAIPLEDGSIGGVLSTAVEESGHFICAQQQREGQERLAQMFEQAPGFMAMLAGPEHRFTLVNPAYTRLVGGRDVVGKTVAEALPDAARQGYVALLDRAYGTGETLVSSGAMYAMQAKPEDQVEERCVDFVIQPLRDSEDKVVGIFLQGTDVTGHHAAQAALRRSEATQRFRAELGDALRSLGHPEEIQAAATRLLCHHLDVSRVHYAEVDGDDLHAVVYKDRHAPSVPDRTGRYRLADFPGLLSECRAGRTFVVANVADDRRINGPEQAIYASLPVLAMVIVPLVKDSQWEALLAVHSSSPRQWSSADLALIEETADRTWAAIARARAEARQNQLLDTLERRVADALAERQLLVEVFEATGAFIQVVDCNYNLLAINKANADEYRRVYGLRATAGDNMLDLLSGFPEQRDMARAHFARALAGETFTVTGKFGDAERGERWYEITFSPLRFANGRAMAAYHFSLDITERRKEQDRLREAEEQLRQSQKMDAIGQLTGGVAHDFNNLLSPIVSSLDLLQRKALGGEREQRLIEGALQSAERARVLVQRLLAFARRQPLHPKPVNIGALVSGMAGLIASTTGPQIKVVVHVDESLPAAIADANQMEMAILNLAVNARDAMPDGGTLRMTTHVETLGSKHRSGLAAGQYVCISVADTGTGMDPSTAQRAIEPFFSTKGIGRGTGLGLSMVHGLASQLGGALTIDSKPGFGTNVEIWLPASTGDAEDARIVHDHVEHARSAVAVLLVDDEELVRVSTAALLMELGYVVTEASSAEEALRLVRNGFKPDLLMTDYLMPGLNGNDLARKLRERWSDLPVLVVSGYTDADINAPGVARLVKPFRYADLTVALRELTDGYG